MVEKNDQFKSLSEKDGVNLRIKFYQVRSDPDAVQVAYRTL